MSSGAKPKRAAFTLTVLGNEDFKQKFDFEDIKINFQLDKTHKGAWKSRWGYIRGEV